MMLALLFALCPQSQSAASETPSVLELMMDAHFRVARSERELAFFDRYAMASEEARARSRSVLERLRAPGTASAAPTSSPTLAKALRALEIPDTGSNASATRTRERLEELIDSLDLQATPGMLAAQSSLEGTRVRIAVSPLYPPKERLQVSLSLVWILPDGSERVAYRGLAKPAVFDAAGFAVELAFPGTQAGTWRLAIEVEQEGISVRSALFELQCVAGLAERAGQVFAGLADLADPRMPLANWLALDMQRGLRTLARVDAEQQLSRLEGRASAVRAYPWMLAFAASEGEAQWIWRLDPPGAAQATLLLLCPSTEPAEASLSRAEWASLEGWSVLSMHLPRGAAGEGTTQELFARLTAILNRAGDKRPIVCLARGDAIGNFAIGFYGAKSRPYAAEVLLMSTTPASAESLAGSVPRMVLAPGGRTTPAESAIGSHTWWLDSSTLALVADFELPMRLKSALPLLLGALRESSKEAK